MRKVYLNAVVSGIAAADRGIGKALCDVRYLIDRHRTVGAAGYAVNAAGGERLMPGDLRTADKPAVPELGNGDGTVTMQALVELGKACDMRAGVVELIESGDAVYLVNNTGLGYYHAGAARGALLVIAYNALIGVAAGNSGKAGHHSRHHAAVLRRNSAELAGRKQQLVVVFHFSSSKKYM